MKFKTIEGPFAICRFGPDVIVPDWATSRTLSSITRTPDVIVPDWATSGGFSSITRTPDELSIICEEAAVPSDVKAERGFRCVRLVGPFDFQAIGILESFLRPLAQAAVPIFAISTYDTDWILIQETHWDRALLVLAKAGHGQVSLR